MSDLTPYPLQPMQPHQGREGTLQALIETLLDRGLVINADITVSVGGVELLGVQIRAALASFDTAARYGMSFPGGTDRGTEAWSEALETKETCPQCGKVSTREELLERSCPWCGWRSARALEAEQERKRLEERPARSAEGRPARQERSQGADRPAAGDGLQRRRE